MKPRAIIMPIVLASVLVGGWWIDKTRAEQASQLSGYFENQPTSAASRIGGRVVGIEVKEGDQVHAGQVLVRLEDQSLAASTEAQQHTADELRAQYLETARGPRPEDIAKQEGAVLEAEADLERLKNGPLPEEIASARAKMEEAHAQYQKALAGSRPEEIASAKAAAGTALEKLRESQRGLTTEERAELKARLDSAVAAEQLAVKDRDRMQYLWSEGAISRQQLDDAISTLAQATDHRKDAEETYKRADEGTPPEELAEARQSYNQAKAQLDLTEAGSRKEDIAAARDELASATASWKLLIRGSRAEDILAAKARLDQQQALLTELRNGSRKEDIARTKAQQQQAQLTEQSQRKNLAERIVYAPFDGTVERIPIAVGDLITTGQEVAQLSNPDDIWLRVYLPESNLGKVRLNDRADLHIDGVPGEVDGVVESIDTRGQFTPANLQAPEERAKQVFGVRIRLARPDRRVKAGMYATVRRVGSWP